ncbi:hypothetical protein MASR2M48_20180 [Spirochaetota bacterium]
MPTDSMSLIPEIDMPDTFDDMAETDFSKARMREKLATIGAFLSPGKRRLLALDEVRSILKIRGEEYQGVKAVALELIIGSEGRYRDFARGFLPRHGYLKDRWVRIDSAHYHDIILPPIRLYELGGVYFVRDGNHRVSVAKLQGALYIDAEVVSLSSTIRIDKGMGIDDIRRALIAFEKKEFYAQTLFGQITDDSDLDFTSPGAYDKIVEHILVHKYYINQGSTSEIDFCSQPIDSCAGLQRLRSHSEWPSEQRAWSRDSTGGQSATGTPIHKQSLGGTPRSATGIHYPALRSRP